MEMLEAPEDIAGLMKKLPGDAPILSVYLPIRPGLNFPQSYKAEAIDLLRGQEQANGAPPSEITDAALSFIREQFAPAGRTLALFVGPTADDLVYLTLGLPLPPLARYQTGPYLAPLQAAMEDNPRIAIVCVDDREARIILTYLGQRESSVHMQDDVPGRQRKGGWAASRYESDRAEHVETHLRRVAQRIEEVWQETPFTRIVFGGKGEVVNALQAFLPAQLQPLVAGVFPLEIFSADAALIAEALPIAEDAERREEIDLAERIKDTALARGQASLGWDETLACLGEGRVHVVAVPFVALGTPDADLALTRAFETGARVEFIGAEAEAVLRDAAGIGAILRF